MQNCRNRKYYLVLLAAFWTGRKRFVTFTRILIAVSFCFGQDSITEAKMHVYSRNTTAPFLRAVHKVSQLQELKTAIFLFTEESS